MRRKLLVAALLVAAALAWRWFASQEPLPIGSGPAGPQVSRRPFERQWAEGPVVLVGVGDSITFGFGAAPRHGYLDLLAHNDDAAYSDMEGRDLAHVHPGLSVRNYAVSGSTSIDHLERQIPSIPTMPRATRGIAVVTSGGNDILHDYGRSAPRDGAMYGCNDTQATVWVAAYQSRLAAIIEGIQRRFPGGCEAFVANVYDPTDGVGDIEHAPQLLPPWPNGLRVLARMNQAISETCAAHPHTHLVDIHSDFLGHGIHCRDRRTPHYRPGDPHYWYAANLEDPNERGYDAIRRAFLGAMVPVLAQARR